MLNQHYRKSVCKDRSALWRLKLCRTYSCLQRPTSIWLCLQGPCTLCTRRTWRWRGSPRIASVPPAMFLPITPWTRPTQASVSPLEIAWAPACWTSAHVNKVGGALSSCSAWTAELHFILSLRTAVSLNLLCSLNVLCAQELPSSCLHHTSTRRMRNMFRAYLEWGLRRSSIRL